jgi:hypothetical protein
MLFEITEKEKKLVMEARQKELDLMTRMEKKRNCVHEFEYVGHGHNDDCYKCKKCGETEWV